MLTSKPGKTLTPRHVEVTKTSSLSPREQTGGKGHEKARKTLSLSRSYSVKDLTEENSELGSELSIDDRLPGVLKIFGESVLPGAEYKSVLASTRSTAQELVKQALERYGQPTLHYVEYVLCEVIGLVETTDVNYAQRPSKKWRTVCRRVLEDDDKPLELQSFWKPCNGFSRRYELHRKVEVVREATADDTTGLNDNARKIMMSKVAPGAIPLSATWNGDSTEFRLHTHDVKSIKREALSDDSGTSSSDVSTGQYPYLLTLRGFTPSRDQIQYYLRSKSTNIGKFRGHPYSSEIGLAAPDILTLHCRLTLQNVDETDSVFVDGRYNYFLEMSICEGASVSLNGHHVTGDIHVYAGDIISIGKHYIFLFKDPTNGSEIPEKLAWFPQAVSNNGLSKTLSRGQGQMQEFLNSSIGASGVFSASFDAGDGGTGGSDGQQVTFAYSKDKEDDLVKAITNIYSCSRRDHPLTPTIIFAACLDHAGRRFTRHHLRNLQRRILFCVREKVADLAKELSAHRYESSVFDYSSPASDSDPLKQLIFWMSNAVHLYVHVLHDLHVLSVNPDPDDEAYSGLQELVAGLEDVVSFSFQQTVYSVTKILYHVVGKVMESNPFSGNETWERDGIGHVISVLQTTMNIASRVRLHTDVMTQLMTYLLFFLSTSLFNRLITTESEAQFYNWTFGVRLQANLSRLEEWSSSKHLDIQYRQVSEPITASADLLAMSKNILVKMEWPAFRTQFSALNESQLLKLLRGYQLGNNRVTPPHWFPAEGGIGNPNNEDLPIKLSSHPSFTLPKEGCPLDMSQTFPEGFLECLEQFQNLYGAEDDDSDSGLSVSNTPRVSDSRPRNTKAFYTVDSPRIEGRERILRNEVLSPPLPPRSSSNAGSPAAIRNTPPQWRGRSQERLPVYNDRSRSLSGPPVKRVPAPIPPKRRTMARVPPLDLPDGRDLSDQNSNLAYSKVLSRSTDSLIRPTKPQERHSSLPKGSILKSPRSATQKSNGAHGGSVNFDDVTRYSDDAYVVVKRLEPRSVNTRPKLLVSDVDENKAGYGSGAAYDATQPRNRRSLPYDDVSSIPPGVTGDTVTVVLNRGTSQLGIGLIDGLHTALKSPGIYIKNLLVDSLAHRCGQLQIGDQILAINGHNIVWEDYQSAMKLFRTSGPKLELTVSKSDSAVVDIISAAKC